MTDFENSIVSAIRDCIDRHAYCVWDESEGLYCCEIYADYRDEADNKSVCEWCKSKTPFDRFYEDLQEWYFDYSISCEEDILSILRHHWDSPISYEDNAEFIEDWVRNHLYFHRKQWNQNRNGVLFGNRRCIQNKIRAGTVYSGTSCCADFR